MAGRIWQPDRERFRRWLRRDVAAKAHGEPVSLAVEGCTGWRYVVEEITAAGYEAHLTEPADTQAARGRKRHAKTDRSDSRLLRELLQTGDLPESWIPPEAVLEWRERVRLYKALVDQRTQWTKRIHTELYQHGVAVPEGNIRSDETRAWLASNAVRLSPAGSPADQRWVPDDRRHRRRGTAAQGGPATLRCPPAPLQGPRRRPLVDHRGNHSDVI